VELITHAGWLDDAVESDVLQLQALRHAAAPRTRQLDSAREAAQAVHNAADADLARQLAELQAQQAQLDAALPSRRFDADTDPAFLLAETAATRSALQLQEACLRNSRAAADARHRASMALLADQTRGPDHDGAAFDINPAAESVIARVHSRRADSIRLVLAAGAAARVANERLVVRKVRLPAITPQQRAGG
jgi:hypothetical protein